MTTIALTVLWAVLLWGALLTARAARTARALDRRRRAVRPPEDGPAPHVVLLVPALREQDLLEEVVRGALALDYPRHLLHIVVVTTEREERERDAALRRLPALATALAEDGARAAARLSGLVPSARAAAVAARVRAAADPAAALRSEVGAVPTTREIARYLLPLLAAEHPGASLHHLHHTAEGAKSSQLVHAVEQLPDLLPPDAVPAMTYVGLYDADSQPDSTTLWHVAQAARAPSGHPPELIQQLPLQLRRPHAARPGRQDVLLRAHALADLRRRAGVEAHRIRACARIAGSGLPSGLAAVAEPVVYGVGAGLFVRHDTLVAIGMYEEPVDDLLIGYKLSSARAGMVVLPVFNLVDRYPSVRSLGNAYAIVAKGSLAGLRRLLTDPVLRTHQPRNSAVFVKELLDTLWWFVGPVVVLAAVTVLALAQAHAQLIVWAAAAFGYTVAHTLWCVRRAESWLAGHQGARERAELPSPGGLRLVHAFLAQPVLHWLGPLRYATGLLGGRSAESGKTER
ncbi:hypothetical protein [Streptomyces sp. NPDC091649]|uniref:hypothetical protein n=1 Tax=Streptomyces sp. NPDC091649 TaxID=3366004 RepID=UPI003822A739